MATLLTPSATAALPLGAVIAFSIAQVIPGVLATCTAALSILWPGA
ncbi:MAG TPA: hypothetical protein VGO40_07400 [Longimicrobium sp.]|jgi:hypothetical protein|nr:hypothetical protein [Longimicrobium sp.]